MAGSLDPPEILPLFPLTGVVLLPGNLLPLHVFEPRYRNLVADVVTEGQHVGMVQPRYPQRDNWGPDAEGEEAPELYAVGCAGRLVRCLETDDGRYVVLLQGVMRFRLEEEVEPLRGYRRARVGYGGFQGDREEVVAEEGLELEGLWQALEEVAEISESFRERLAEMSPIRQLNHLSAGLPLAPQEKQALLEAATAEERLGLLVELVRTGLAERGVDERWRTN